MLLHAHASPDFWAEALATTTYLLNWRPCRATPHQILFGTPPTYDHLRVFGSLCYPNQSATAAHKLSPRSVACVFLGYPADYKGYRCYECPSAAMGVPATPTTPPFTTSPMPQAASLAPHAVTPPATSPAMTPPASNASHGDYNATPGPFPGPP
jgi:hypothetical protein